MRDVNGSSFFLLAEPADWPVASGMTWSPDGADWSLAGTQSWRLPARMKRMDALDALAKAPPMVFDAFGAVARVTADGLGVESLDGENWFPLVDIDGKKLAPKIGRFLAMALGGARLALVASDGAQSFLELFDLRGRWGLDSPDNPALPIELDPAGAAVAAAADGPIYVLVKSGVAIYEGGPAQDLLPSQSARFEPVAAGPDPLRRTALIGPIPGGAARAMAADPARIAFLTDQSGGVAQILSVLDRATGAWAFAPAIALDDAPLPFFTDVALLSDGLIALLAPASDKDKPFDCAVVTLVPSKGVALAPYRYPMLAGFAPRFSSIPGPGAQYLRGAEPRPLLPLPYPAYRQKGGLGRFGLAASDPDLVWHRLYAEANLPPGSSLTIFARAAEEVLEADACAVLTDVILLAPADMTRIDDAAAAAVAKAHPEVFSGPLPDALLKKLAAAPFHRQPRLVASRLVSELPFHPGLAAQAGLPGGLFELLLQRGEGANRRLSGRFLDIVAVASSDGRASPCLRAIRVYAPRFCYQDQYLPMLFHQTSLSGETDRSPAPSPPDFRERLLASLEGMLTPIENRVASAEFMLDPHAAPAAMLPWLASYLGLKLDPGWPEARRRRALALAGRQLRQRGTYRGVCLALDIATDGAVARGEVVVIETHWLRRTGATLLGISLGGRNPLTGNAVPSGNSVVGDTLVLSAERAKEVLALIAPSAVDPADAAAVARFLDEYADRVQVAAIVQGESAAALRPVVTAVLQAESPAQLSFEVVVAERRFVLGLSPLLDIDTFLDAPVEPGPIMLGRSVVGRDAVVRNPAALRQ